MFYLIYLYIHSFLQKSNLPLDVFFYFFGEMKDLASDYLVLTRFFVIIFCIREIQEKLILKKKFKKF